MLANSTRMQIEIIDLPKIIDPRGNLSVIEGKTLPFPIQRVYFLYDVPSGAERGGHAHIDQKEFLIATSGSFDVILTDGTSEEKVTLNKPNQGLLIPQGIWRELKNFSSGAVCLVIASDVYLEEDYIRDFDDFLKYIHA
jgi:dTDP-4-dehydrorhamnose 3,5-epimerase-like enzyme